MKVSNSEKDYQTPEKPKRPKWRAMYPLELKGGSVRIFQHPLLQNINNLKGGPFGEKNQKKVSQCRKKLKGGTLCDFSTSLLSQNIKKLKGDSLGIFFEKSHNAEKNWMGRPFSLSRYGMLRGKKGKPFLVQFARSNIQLGTIKFCITFKNYFGQFVWIEKSDYISRVSLHEAPNKKAVFFELAPAL